MKQGLLLVERVFISFACVWCKRNGSLLQLPLAVSGGNVLLQQFDNFMITLHNECSLLTSKLMEEHFGLSAMHIGLAPKQMA